MLDPAYEYNTPKVKFRVILRSCIFDLGMMVVSAACLQARRSRNVIVDAITKCKYSIYLSNTSLLS